MKARDVLSNLPRYFGGGGETNKELWKYKDGWSSEETRNVILEDFLNLYPQTINKHLANCQDLSTAFGAKVSVK